MKLFPSLKNIVKKFYNSLSISWTTSTSLSEYLGTNITTKTGIVVTEDSALYVAPVYSCVNLLASTIASLPIEIYATEQDGDIFADKKNPIRKLLRFQPNKWQTSYDYWLYNVECMLLKGGFISWINRSSTGKPLSLIPLNPANIIRNQTSLGNFTISGHINWGDKNFIEFDNEPQENFFWANYRTLDTVNPCSIIKYAAESIGLAQSAAEHGARVFKNDATPPIVVKYPAGLTAAGAKQTAELWKAGGSGDNYGSPRFIDKGADIVRLSMSNEDAQYMESRKFSQEEIAGLFRVPPHFIRDAGTGKGWATLSELGEEFLTYTLNPYLINIEQAINRTFIPENKLGENFGKFDTKVLTKANVQARTSYYRDLYYLGAINSDEIRLAEGYNKKTNEEGEKYYHQANLIEDGKEPINKEVVTNERV